jgi:hypothetical protein
MATACTGSHTCTQPASPPPLLITIAKNTNIRRTRTRSSIPYQYHLTVHHTITITTISHSTSPLAQTSQTESIHNTFTRKYTSFIRFRFTNKNQKHSQTHKRPLGPCLPRPHRAWTCWPRVVGFGIEPFEVIIVRLL